ncbi:MAG TPA: hypothetical protein VFB03_02405 [Candidatus Saccharimonadales bacterium]|nr:hypothetical protein [Candidatus Saccharimonadales bacterium]
MDPIKKAAKDLIGDMVVATVLGVIGFVCISIGVYWWPPLIIVGVLFILLALFIANIYP